MDKVNELFVWVTYFHLFKRLDVSAVLPFGVISFVSRSLKQW